MSTETRVKTKKIGKYTILRELGHGGMAVVYEALDTENDRRTALKTLPPNLVDRRMVSRFHREGRAQAGLNHPNIVKVYDVGTADGTHYLALELVKGKTVRSILKRSGRLSVEKTLNICRQVCDALNYAHESLCIHRDIKSGNIMVDDSGHVKILDFGLVQITGMTIITQTGSVVGTPEYMSPEQIAGEEVDYRTDLYSLGVTMYEMLTGRLPFTGNSPQTIANEVRFGELVPMRESVPDISIEVEELVRRALAKNREERFQTAAEMAQAIDACLNPPEPEEPAEVEFPSGIELLRQQQSAGEHRDRRARDGGPGMSSLVSFLIEKGTLEAPQAKEIYLKQLAEKGTSFRDEAVARGLVEQTEMMTVSAEWSGIPVREGICDVEIDEDVKSLVPQKVAERFKVLPLALDDGQLVVGMVNPLDVFAVDYLEILTDTEVKPVFISLRDHRLAFEKLYEQGQKYKNILDELGIGEEKEIEIVDEEAEASVVDIDDESVSEAPIIKLVNYMIQRAVGERASDIHIEPDESRLRVRYRVDGVLHEAMSPPKELHTSIVSRIKIMAELDIAERRLPQDGRIKLRVDNSNIDLRVSTLPGIYGEKVVVRILDEARMLLKLTDLGFEEDDLQRWERMIRQPYGIVLVTGPTGSGKTTTLYSTLNTINSIDTNIITVEDPVEYRLEGINQVQVNPKAGITFATGLRSIFRQDPDIVMVGEMRDLETAQISVKASLTGHLVFSTLHTNDAAGTIARLADIGVAPYLVASSLIGVLALRLVREICPSCREQYEPSQRELQQAGIGPGEGAVTLFRGVGCRNCGGTGYRGRTALVELMEMNEELKRLVVASKPSGDLLRAARRNGMRTLREQGLRKVRRGLTTLEELYRRTASLEEEKPVAGVSVQGQE